MLAQEPGESRGGEVVPPRAGVEVAVAAQGAGHQLDAKDAEDDHEEGEERKDVADGADGPREGWKHVPISARKTETENAGLSEERSLRRRGFMDLMRDSVLSGRRTRNVRRIEMLIWGRSESSEATTTAEGFGSDIPQ